MFDLSNKVIVVTGGAGLLGSSIVGTLKKMRATVISLDIVKNAEAEFNEIIDITNHLEIESCIKNLCVKHGKIDGWINNAYPRTEDWGQDLEQIEFDSWEKNVSMQMNSYFFCCQQVCKTIKNQGSGSVINMGSIYGILGPDFSVYDNTEMTMPAAYSAIKGGIVNLSRYFASYYGAYGIRINTISPGGILNNQPDSFVTNYSSKVPARRLGKPDDISGACVFLMSDESSYITGHNLIIDGGWSII